jgi:hypothetical protein
MRILLSTAAALGLLASAASAQTACNAGSGTTPCDEGGSAVGRSSATDSYTARRSVQSQSVVVQRKQLELLMLQIEAQRHEVNTMRRRGQVCGRGADGYLVCSSN